MTSIIENGLSKNKDLNCAETMLYAANEAYDLQLPHSALKLAAGFGGGMGIQSTCGALTGGIMALSAIFVKERARESDQIKRLDSEFFDTFKSKMNSIDCSYLKEHYEEPEIECHPVIVQAAQIVEELIDRELARTE